jgi:colanic acid/amylovoran biosynthesis glycosyltransferase
VSTRPDLVLLTIAFPFGNRSETFLESEIDVLAERFCRVYVLPSHREPGMRLLPANVELVEMDWLDGPTRAAKRLALVSAEAARVLLSMLRSGTDMRPYLQASRTYLDILAKAVLKLRSLTSFVQEHRLANAVFYDYWFENSTLALALLRQSATIRTAVSRVHGFDLYDERWNGGTVPFREVKAGALDAIFAVSASGAAYLEARLPVGPLRAKVKIEHLGVRDPGRACPGRTDAMPLIVTCANLIPDKRVHLVPGVLARLRHPIRWVHFGDGPERQRVTEAASRLDSEVVWEMRGHVDNGDVLRFYDGHHVDALLSLSASEGLPVSMMEAQSYGIPIVAVGVGGVPEIVNTETGVLLSSDATPPEIAAGLEAALQPERFDPDSVREFFRERFEAGVNYNRFVDGLLALHEGQLASS